ncbi:hypothetical protein AT3G30730 [Arabidopsis thaliana]|nr:uncharacterized protein AT3G30730 [Arabidopsis thaliana]AEE77655.2 hypothetical protein AT3G30730 [Arabidopsis thaliana]|eukprot:NP_001319671.1 hypothetical protein AT3G30730 [Arabidopsis thaliana]
MAPHKAQQSLQPYTFQNFDDIDGDFCQKEVLLRLIYIWEARNIKKGNILMGFELLFIYSQSNPMEGFISANRIFPYQEDLKYNSIYKLNKVEWCNSSNAIKYLFKYVTKGVNKSAIFIEKGTNTTSNSED